MNDESVDWKVMKIVLNLNKFTENVLDRHEGNG